jgi:hypothetical protein
MDTLVIYHDMRKLSEIATEQSFDVRAIGKLQEKINYDLVNNAIDPSLSRYLEREYFSIYFSTLLRKYELVSKRAKIVAMYIISPQTMIKNRLESVSADVGTLNVLPMDVRRLIGSMLT